MIAHGADVNVKDDYQKTPLHGAAEYGSKKVVETLIEKGADIHVLDDESNTPLHNASEDTVECLIEHGADVNAKNNDGETPLWMAVDYAHVELALQLVTSGAEFEIIDDTEGKEIFRIVNKDLSEEGNECMREVKKLLGSKSARN